MFNKAFNKLIQFPGGVLGAYEVPAGITTIGSGAFRGASLTEIVFPVGLSSVESQAFIENGKLKNVFFRGDAPSVVAGVFSAGVPAVYYLAGRAGWSSTLSGLSALQAVKPTISAQPQSATIAVGSPATLTVTGTGVPAPSYQWRKGGVPVAGATNPSLTVSAVGFGDAGSYDVILSNFGGETASSSAVITIRSATTDGLIYSTADAVSIALTGYSGSASQIVIPESLSGFPVTSIGSSAFQGKSQLSAVTIPNSITAIGSRAFYLCSGLTSITIPPSVRLIEESAFRNTGLKAVVIPSGVTKIATLAFGENANLVSVSIPDTVTTIESGPFTQCPKLVTIQVASNNTAFSSEGNALYNKSKTELIQGPIGFTGVFVIPATVTAIRNQAFEGGLLTGATMPEGLKTLGAYSFRWCRSLENFTVPSTVTSFGYSVLDGSLKLSFVVFRGDAPSFGSGTFNGSGVGALFFSPGRAGWNASTVDGINVYPDGTLVIRAHPQGQVLASGSSVNLSISALSSSDIKYQWRKFGVPIPNATSATFSLASVGPSDSGAYDVSLSNALAAATSSPAILTITASTSDGLGFSVDGSAAVITGYAGAGGEIVIPESISGLPVKVIGPGVFQGKSALTGVTIPNSVEKIGSRAFYLCSSLANVTIPSSVRIIEESAFRNCGIVNAVIPSGVTSLGTLAFGENANLTSVSIPATVTTIESGPFVQCPKLVSIQVDPNNANFASDSNALYDKAKTTLLQGPTGFSGNFIVASSVVSVSDRAFEGGSLSGVILPEGVKTLGAYSFRWCKTLENVTVPRTVISLGNNAFEGCSKLPYVTFRGNAPTESGGTFYGSGVRAVFYSQGSSGWWRGDEFEGSTANWSGGKVEVLDSSYGSVLGRFGMNEEVRKRIELLGRATSVTFSFFRIDSWDNEKFEVYANGVKVIDQAFGQTQVTSIVSGETAGYKWSIQPKEALSVAASAYQDQRFEVSISIPAGLYDLTLRMRSTLNQAVADESWAIDNFRLPAESFAGALAFPVGAPFVTKQPLPTSVSVGTGVSFTVEYTGDPAPTIQWRKNGFPLAGETKAQLLIANAKENDAGDYDVELTNSLGFTASLQARLSVQLVPPVVSGAPTAIGTVGYNFSYKIEASNSPNGYSVMPALPQGLSLNSATGVISGKPLSAGVYAVSLKASNPVGQSGGFALTITVSSPSSPSFVTSPEPRVLTATGGSVSFASLAGGSPEPSYQWFFNGMLIPGATTAILNISAVTIQDVGRYYVTATNSSGSVKSGVATLEISQLESSATHAVVGNGYVAGQSLTVTNQLSFSGEVSALSWAVLLPNGWSFGSATGNGAAIAPVSGQTGLIEWAWIDTPGSPVKFSYVLNVPVDQVGTKELVALIGLRAGGAFQFLARPDPLTVSQFKTHSADVNGDGRVNLTELTRVIEIYNTRNGTFRTGAYANAVVGTSEDGFISASERSVNSSATLERYHSADSNRDGRLSIMELTRVIELYNYRSGTTRTGQYKPQTGTEDGFAPGP